VSVMTLPQLGDYCAEMATTDEDVSQRDLWALLATEINVYLTGPDHDALPGLS